MRVCGHFEGRSLHGCEGGFPNVWATFGPRNQRAIPGAVFGARGPGAGLWLVPRTRHRCVGGEELRFVSRFVGVVHGTEQLQVDRVVDR